jgi:C4-dicarboxylate-specific signal transduction histidine kinase
MEVLGEHWRRLMLLCVLVIAVVAISLTIASKVWRDRRTAARLLREPNARDEVRLGERLSELTAQAHVADDEKNKGTEAERKKRS